MLLSKSCNSKMAHSDQAALRQSIEQQASLKPA